MIRTTIAFLAGCLISSLASVAANTAPIPVFKGRPPNEAAEALLVAGMQATDGGSWERIAVGAVYFEGYSDKARGQAIFDEVLRKGEWTDYQRVARFHAELGDWENARVLYDKAISMKPRGAVLLAEAGAYYNLHGDRDKAEELFTRAFQADSNNPWAYAIAAASYLKVKPRPW